MTELVEADAEGIERAAALIRAAGVVGMPTETVYGLAGDATSDEAVAAIFDAKGRPPHNPLIAHVLDLDAAIRLGRVDGRARMLAERFWPGPLTLVLPLRPEAGLARAMTAGLGTVAVRAPAHPVARALLAAVDRPLAAPSANRSGTLSPTRGQHVAQSLEGRVPLVLEGGNAQVGLESTIVDLTSSEAVILRPGAITAAALAEVLGFPVHHSEGRPDRPTAPGQLLRHYAPVHSLRLDATSCSPTEAWLGFGGDPPGPCAHRLDLSPDGVLEEAAAHLFAYLRRLDQLDVSCIAVAPIPEDGIGRAIRDRLVRAARG